MTPHTLAPAFSDRTIAREQRRQRKLGAERNSAEQSAHEAQQRRVQAWRDGSVRVGSGRPPIGSEEA